MQTKAIAGRFDRKIKNTLCLSLFTLLAAGCAHREPTSPAAPVAAAVPKVPKQAATPEEAGNAPQPVMEQRAMDRLKKMHDTLAAAQSFRYRSRNSTEVPAKTGQNLTIFADTDVAVQRPNKLRAIVTGDGPHFHVIYDGSKLSALDPEKNLYAVTDAPGTIDETLKFMMDKSGIHFPSSDVLFSDPFGAMSKDLISAFVVGPSRVDGFLCDHLALMGPGVNWEVWIDSGKNAVPRRLAVTYKEVTNFPRFMLEFTDWQLNPKLPSGTFVFKKPQNARQIDFAPRMDAEIQQLETPK